MASSSPDNATSLCIKLCYLSRAKHLSVSPSSLTFSQLISSISQAFPDIGLSSQSSSQLELTSRDGDEDMVVIDGDETLHRLACLYFQRSQPEVFRVYIRVKKDGESRTSRRTVPCRYFQMGSCKFGSSCTFLHESPNMSTKAASMTIALCKEPLNKAGIDTWLTNQMKSSEHDNISYLSSLEGYESFISILSYPNLPHKSISELVGMLTRPKFCTSLLKRTTDKMYNALVGSQFLKALHGHIRCAVKPSFGCLEPYVKLCEEIVERTSNGWKEAPLDELKVLVDEMEGSSAAELCYILARLLEHRATKKEKMEAVHDEQGSNNFRDLPIIPCKEEFLCRETRRALPVNRVGGRYPNVETYLDTHFRLLREDCMAGLRDGIHELRNGAGAASDLYLYTDVRVLSIAFGKNGVVCKLSFNVGTMMEWAQRLLHGSLVCMSCDKFQTFSWAVVAPSRTVELLSQSMVSVVLLEDSQLHSRSVYMMAESSFAFFPAYSPVLRSLQQLDTHNLPFLEHFIHLQPLVKEPFYLKERNAGDVYDFDCAFPLMKKCLPSSQFHIMQPWPEWTTSLDKSQMSALKHALTKRLALIQGPPGTGKTFVGLLIVKIMLSNLKQAQLSALSFPKESNIPEETNGGPILIICYTNHALDQFLEGIYAHEENVIRVGGQSKSPQLESRSLKTLVRQRSVSLVPSLHKSRKQAHHQRTRLLEEISTCLDLLDIDTATPELLDGIATEEQKKSLFFEGCDRGNVLNMWLHEQDRRMQMGHQEEQISGDTERQIQPQSKSHFNALREEGASCEIYDSRPRPDHIESSISNIMKAIEPRVETTYESRGSSPESMSSMDGPSVMEQKGWSLEMLKSHVDVWSLDGKSRRILHANWVKAIRQRMEERMDLLSTAYQEACETEQQIDSEIKLSILRTAKVVGMTTTAAARLRLHSMLKSLQAQIVIIEEAAEVLETHILACLTNATKHLILIGDHLQLRPFVAVHTLAVEHHLDVSLFERLVKSGIEYVTLEVQRRMRPCISKLISTIYPMLQDHESVSARDSIKGVSSNVFFLHHTAQEEHGGDDDLGKGNVEEAQLVVELCSYLLKQGYTHTDITILSMYKGQTNEILQRLLGKVNHGSGKDVERSLRVSSVEDYQGEECKIIILSLGRIWSLATPNRLCVALSRAKDGLYIFGDGELLSQKSGLWGSVIKELQDSNSYGQALTLRCQNHPDHHTTIQNPNDFHNVPDGGCDKPCEYQWSCGHACPKRCHPGSHDKIVCPKHCLRKLPACSHQCQSICHGLGECPICKVLVVKQLPRCGHSARVACSTLIETVICREPCPRLFACSHKCESTCGWPCMSLCKQLVEKILPCGHTVKLECHLDSTVYVCTQPCKQRLTDCQHICQGTCGKCKQGKEHV